MALLDRPRFAALPTRRGTVGGVEKLFPQENKNLYQWQPDSGLGYVLEERGGAWSYTTIGEE